jgi:hypothetical protein
MEEIGLVITLVKNQWKILRRTETIKHWKAKYGFPIYFPSNEITKYPGLRR